MPIKPTKVLCKRTYTIGKPYWWDDTKVPPVRHETDNRTFVAGEWYDVVPNENDVWDEQKRRFTFTILNNQQNLELFFMYDEEDRDSWPDICTKYGPRDYAKWFYTPEEMELLNKGEFKLQEDINIKPGNYYWVKNKDGNWIIALCRAHNVRPGKFNWQIIGSIYDHMDDDFLEIGEQVISQEKHKEEKEIMVAQDELIDEVVVLIDSINKNDPDGNYAPIEYIMPFVNKAVNKYFRKTMKNLTDFFA